MCEYFDNDYRRPPFPGMPFGPQFFPPFGFPPGHQQGPPQGFPPHGQSSGPPSGPPPSFTPQQAPSHGPGVFAVDPGAIRPCTFRYSYIWLENGDQFWAWLVFVGRNSASGWKWNRRRWIYFGVDLRNIDSFICY